MSDIFSITSLVFCRYMPFKRLLVHYVFSGWFDVRVILQSRAHNVMVYGYDWCVISLGACLRIEACIIALAPCSHDKHVVQTAFKNRKEI